MDKTTETVLLAFVAIGALAGLVLGFPEIENAQYGAGSGSTDRGAVSEYRQLMERATQDR
ncbi:MAG TPA: hypothetical protein V6D46_09740 [Coleofasciculaceae cyanobacterium]